MSRRLFSLEGTGSARANPWRYEIPVRMCSEWLVVRPLASIKLTAELLLVMPDILTALKAADTRVFEVKDLPPTAIVLLTAVLLEGTVEQTKGRESELLAYCFSLFL